MTSEKPPRTLTETSNFRPSIPAENAGKLSSLYLTSIEFRNTALEKRPISMDYGQSWLIRSNIAIFNIGMAFELIYKVLSLCDSGRYIKTHVFATLHNDLYRKPNKRWKFV